jgi:hypothetical protein
MLRGVPRLLTFAGDLSSKIKLYVAKKLGTTSSVPLEKQVAQLLYFNNGLLPQYLFDGADPSNLMDYNKEFFEGISKVAVAALVVWLVGDQSLKASDLKQKPQRLARWKQYIDTHCKAHVLTTHYN